MAYETKQTVENFYQLIKEGWEPSFRDIKDKYYPTDKYSSFQREKLARQIVSRVRRRLKKEGLYFYGVNHHFKLLASSKDRFDVTNSLWKITTGFHKSTNSLLEDTARMYPRLSREMLAEIKAGFNITSQIQQGITLMLKNVLDKLEVEDENKHK